jgi:hypothetical protein
MVKKTDPDALLRIPFDQYGRYLMVSNTIKELASLKKQKKFTILDVGGYNGSLHYFFEKDRAAITILDVYDSKDADYVKGTALKMPFKDNFFDYVVSFEVFEHIPRADREQFIKESLRVSKGSVLLTAPFAGANEEVVDSEKLVNGLWKSIHQKDHQWLHEHIIYKTPKVEELEAILRTQKMPYKKVGNNELLLWNLMQSLTFLTTMYRDSGVSGDVQEFYNQNLQDIESITDKYYRYIFLIGGDSKRSLKSMNQDSKENDPKKTYELINRIFLSIKEDVAKLKKDWQAAANQVDGLKEQVQSLQQEVDAIKSSSSWKVGNKIASVGRKVPGGKKASRWIK